jgi:CRP-like cAMP-binding protein
VHIKNSGCPLDNKLLAALPRHQFDLLAPHLTTVSLQQGEVLAEPGDEFDQVYFPQSGMLWLLAVLRDGKAIETATVGREGVVGAMAGLGLYKSLVRVVVQLPMMVSKIPATQFRKAAAQSDAVRNMCIQYNEVLLSQGRVTAACNALHVVEARFCRWLLQSADRAESDNVALTHEFLAEMLGVRRTSVTEVASKIQAAGAISYTRGQITILKRSTLEKMCCECYQTLVDQSAVLISRGGFSHSRSLMRITLGLQSRRAWKLDCLPSRALVRRLIACLTVEGIPKFQADDLEARWNGFHDKLIRPFFWL